MLPSLDPHPRFVASDIHAPTDGCPECIDARNQPALSLLEPSTDTLQGIYLCPCGALWSCAWRYSSTKKDRLADEWAEGA